MRLSLLRVRRSDQACPLCRTPIEPGDALSVCERCRTQHHGACAAELGRGRCAALGCGGALGAERRRAEPPGRAGTCLACEGAIVRGQPRRACGVCRAHYHADCAMEVGLCLVPGCGGVPARRVQAPRLVRPGAPSSLALRRWRERAFVAASASLLAVVLGLLALVGRARAAELLLLVVVGSSVCVLLEALGEARADSGSRR